MNKGSYHAVEIINKNGKAKKYKVYKLKDSVKPVIETLDYVDVATKYFFTTQGTKLRERMEAKTCEICGKTQGYFEVHHVKKLKDIKDGTERWKKQMIARNRKTMVLCVECHDLLHAGKLPDWKYK